MGNTCLPISDSKTFFWSYISFFDLIWICVLYYDLGRCERESWQKPASKERDIGERERERWMEERKKSSEKMAREISILPLPFNKITKLLSTWPDV